jgi:hypothetical protein
VVLDAKPEQVLMMVLLEEEEAEEEEEIKMGVVFDSKSEID